METVIIVIHLMVVIALVILILLQKSEGGALGIGGGGAGGGSNANFLSGRGSASALTRATTFLAFGFFATSITLTLIANQTGGTRSILDQIEQSAPGTAVPAPGGTTTTDDLLNQIPGATTEPSGPQVPLSE